MILTKPSRCSCAAGDGSRSTSSRRAGSSFLLRLADQADAMFETFRPGVAERLGIRTADMYGPQPSAGIWAHDRLGPGRTMAQVALLAVPGLDPAELPDQTDRTLGPQ